VEYSIGTQSSSEYKNAIKVNYVNTTIYILSTQYFFNPYVGWVCCWFSPLLREVFLRVLRFSPPLKNQHFQIPIRSGTHGHVSTSSYELLSDPWVNKLQFTIFTMTFNVFSKEDRKTSQVPQDRVDFQTTWAIGKLVTLEVPLSG